MMAAKKLYTVKSKISCRCPAGADNDFVIYRAFLCRLAFGQGFFSSSSLSLAIGGRVLLLCSGRDGIIRDGDNRHTKRQQNGNVSFTYLCVQFYAT